MKNQSVYFEYSKNRHSRVKDVVAEREARYHAKRVAAAEQFKRKPKYRQDYLNQDEYS